MAQEKKAVEAITPINEDFARWYTDIVTKAELVDYSSVKGCVILRPYGYAIWENIQSILDGMFKKLGHENVYMPMFIPESLLQKEKDHVEGFAPEVAWVTHGGEEELAERMCVRPTSETLFCDHYAHIIQSYRDLPKLYNQWCSVVRWEKTTRPFLRTREFLWQEGHTMHETEEEAVHETEQMLECYRDFCENYLMMPVITGRKTESEKFAGAVATYTIEAMMHDGRALQSGTSHFFGDGFARAFDITFTGRDNKLQYPFQTSWGVSTRLMGAIIMSHGDDNGLILPPAVAPIQAIVVPIAQHKEGVIDAAQALCDRLKAAGIRASIDVTDNSPGWKFAQYEMKGVPVRVEIGPRDIENGNCVLVRRDKGEKTVVSLDSVEDSVKDTLDALAKNIYRLAKENMQSRTVDCHTFDELEQAVNNSLGFYNAMWCGDEACEDELKEKLGIGSRCMPFEQKELSGTCVCCGKPAKAMVIWGKAY
ncbi:MAG: proline--tRNA ligase [Oscillospiraceae bacterium]|nr:proline--tRNA ligase [Oscillospiraceae bacterium]